MKSRNFTIFLILTFYTYCNPVHKELVKLEKAATSDGFVNRDTFQVKCSTSIFQIPDQKILRRELLAVCRNHLVIMLAEFKIVYDFNKSAAYRVTESNFVERKLIHINDAKQLQIKWEDKQIHQLQKHYENLLPGHIRYEWIEQDRVYFIYLIKYPDLLSTIKNSPLPFGVEFY